MTIKFTLILRLTSQNVFCLTQIYYDSMMYVNTTETTHEGKTSY